MQIFFKLIRPSFAIFAIFIALSIFHSQPTYACKNAIEYAVNNVLLLQGKTAAITQDKDGISISTKHAFEKPTITTEQLLTLETLVVRMITQESDTSEIKDTIDKYLETVLFLTPDKIERFWELFHAKFDIKQINLLLEQQEKSLQNASVESQSTESFFDQNLHIAVPAIVKSFIAILVGLDIIIAIVDYVSS